MAKKRLYKKADINYAFIVIVLVLLIVIAFILVNSGVFGKTEKFVSTCVSVSPVFEYECANKIKGSTGTSCPGGWTVDSSKKCAVQNNAEVQCCYRERAS